MMGIEIELLWSLLGKALVVMSPFAILGVLLHLFGDKNGIFDSTGFFWMLLGGGVFWLVVLHYPVYMNRKSQRSNYVAEAPDSGKLAPENRFPRGKTLEASEVGREPAVPARKPGGSMVASDSLKKGVFDLPPKKGKETSVPSGNLVFPHPP
jgi:hypothetical protein